MTDRVQDTPTSYPQVITTTRVVRRETAVYEITETTFWSASGHPTKETKSRFLCSL